MVKLSQRVEANRLLSARQAPSPSTTVVECDTAASVARSTVGFSNLYIELLQLLEQAHWKICHLTSLELYKTIFSGKKVWTNLIIVILHLLQYNFDAHGLGAVFLFPRPGNPVERIRFTTADLKISAL